MTRRLNPVDADMLYGETPSWHMHVGALLVLDPSTAPQRLGFEEWLAFLDAQVNRIPAMRERVVFVPLGLDRPLWARDPAFDLGAHVRQVTAASPGGRRELATVAGEFLARKLDRSRPLWEMWFVDGLADGQVAILAKVHHAATDGLAGALLLGEFLDTEPVSSPGVDRANPVGESDRIPSNLSLVTTAVVALALAPLRAVKPLMRTLSSIDSVRRLRGSDDWGSPALPFQAPRCAFNQPVTPDRCFEFASLPLDDIKAVNREFGVTVNDVVLALCAGALRRYLRGRGTLPDRPLVAAVPVSKRGPEDLESFGNIVSGLFVTLPTDVSDPVERLVSAHRHAQSAKQLYGSGIEDAVMDWAAVPAPVALGLGVRLYTWAHLARRLPPVFNLLVSNVPGSPVPLYLAGARLVATYPFGPVLDAIGINITVLSYEDAVHVGLVSCPELVPDPWLVVDGLRDSLTELIPRAGAPDPRG